MALNYRRSPIKAQSDNPTNLVGKPAVGKETAVRRPALCEIKNKISLRDPDAKKAPVKKPDAKVPRTVSLKDPKDTKKVSKNVPANLKLVKKPAISTKFEAECKIKEESVPQSFSSQRFDELEEKIIGNDPQFVPEYINDIFAHLRCLEEKYKVDPTFLAYHKTTSRMRIVLINWLVEVQVNFHLLPETLHLCVAIIDRYLQKNKTVGRENLQLVGITALWIAGKYEEMYIPKTGDFMYLCDNIFTINQMMKMELSIIKALDYSFGRPLSLHFLRRYSRVSNVQPQEHALAKYLLELCLIEQELCHVKPSLQAAAAMYLSLSVLNGGASNIWSKTLIHYSTYSFADLEKTVKHMAEAVVKAETSKYQAIRTKYAASNNGKISLCNELKGPIIKKLTKND